ncbi:imidazole glycerol phosphate synthase subunit HisH, partial [Micromonospora sp. HK10]|uniref:imidazole glycerol phosphate synthase subunit HisH n=1 Tax=Micromonospora sp. HK10 TaxID=1538294 RepID=UPI0006274795
MGPRVVVLDYGSGNLRSAERALARAGAEVTVTDDLTAAARALRVAAGRPVLGICVGMQVLFEHGDEHGVVTKGLGLLPGGVTKLPADRLPHMGWN